MGRHLIARNLSIAAIGETWGRLTGYYTLRWVSMTKKMPYSRVAVGDTESRQLTKMGPTSCYVTKATYSRTTL